MCVLQFKKKDEFSWTLLSAIPNKEIDDLLETLKMDSGLPGIGDTYKGLHDGDSNLFKHYINATFVMIEDSNFLEKYAELFKKEEEKIHGPDTEWTLNG